MRFVTLRALPLESEVQSALSLASVTRWLLDQICAYVHQSSLHVAHSRQMAARDQREDFCVVFLFKGVQRL